MVAAGLLVGLLWPAAGARAQPQEAPSSSRPAWLQSPQRKSPLRIEETLLASGRDLWAVRHRSDAKFEIYFRRIDSLTGVREDNLGRAGRLQRLLLSPGHPIAAAAWGEWLHVLYEDFSSQSFIARPVSENQPLPSLQTRQLPPLILPLEVRWQLKGWVAGASGPVVLFREEKSGQFSWKLFKLDDAHRTWIEVPVSLALHSADRIDLVMLDGAADHFALVTQSAGSLGVHTPGESGWTTLTHALTGSDPSRFISLKNHLAEISPRRDGDQTRLHLSLFRAGERLDLGLLGVVEPGIDWRAIRVGEEIGLVLIDPEQNLKWLRRGLQAPQGATLVPEPIELATDPPVVWDPMTAVLISAVLLSMLLMLSASRRDPTAIRPNLPKTLQAAGAVRIAAAFVDLAIPLGLVMLWSGEENPTRILSTWMQTPTNWREVSDSLSALGLYLLHTTISEALTGSTLGKSLFGCRVTSLTGERPRLWQILIRNLFKAVELMPPFLLLILPLMNRHRQRLGDFVGRTVVVSVRDEDEKTGLDDEMD